MSQLALTRRISKLSDDAKVCKVETVLEYQDAMKPIFQAQADLRSWFSQQFDLLEEAECVIGKKFSEANK